MARLTINGQKVTVDDSFLSMTPEQQNSTVDEIAASIGASPAPAVDNSQPPAGSVPGSPQYAQWAAQRAREQVAAGQRPNLPQVSADPNSAQMNYDTALERVRQGQFPDMNDEQWAEYSGSVLAPVNPTQQGMAGSVLGFSDEIAGGVAGIGSGLRQVMGGGGPGAQQTFNDVQQLEEARYRLGQEQNGMAGGVVETVGSLGAFGPGRKLLFDAMSKAGPLLSTVAQNVQKATLPQFLKTAAASTATGGITGYAQGFGTANGGLDERNQGGLAGGAAGSAIGLGVPVVGQALTSAGNRVAQGLTGFLQNRLTNTAIKGAPQASEIFSTGSQLLEAATGGTPLAVSNTAFNRFFDNVKTFTNKLRINPDNDQQAIGLLNTLSRVSNEVAQGGVAVDIKDLHLLRQLAQKVSGSPKGRDALLGKTVVRQLDDMIRGLKPDDILGGGDPSQAVNDLFKGISAWHKASKLDTIENAIANGSIAASGPEKGIRNAFRAIMKSDEWPTFTAAEKKAISDVVNGTGRTNLLKLIGTFGFGGNTATNGIGGASGMALGGMAGGPVGMVAAPILGAIGKVASERATTGLANKAAQVIGAENIPVARQMALPASIQNALALLGRTGSPASVSASQ